MHVRDQADARSDLIARRLDAPGGADQRCVERHSAACLDAEVCGVQIHRISGIDLLGQRLQFDDAIAFEMDEIPLIGVQRHFAVLQTGHTKAAI